MTRLILHGSGKSGTTITQRIINSHPDIWMTNEFLLYDMAFGYYLEKGRNISTPRRHFETILRRGKWSLGKRHSWHIPHTLNMQTFVEQCLGVLSEDSPCGRILAMEKILYGSGAWKYFGDKVLEPTTLKHLIDIKLSYKAIYIYRDARDNVVSRRKARFKKRKGETRSQSWARCMNQWFEIKRLLGDENCVELRFEDYVNNVGTNGQKLENFLGLSGLVVAEKILINQDATNIGHYKQFCPDWKETFHPEAIKLLKELKYIGEGDG